MPDYLLTISAQQKKDIIKHSELEDIQFWLQAHGVIFVARRYESTGQYKQLHFHGLVRYKGKFAHLTSWGDKDFTQNTFSINFKRVTNYKGAITYLLKPGSTECHISLHRRWSGGAPTPSAKRAGNWGGEASTACSHNTLSTILKRTL